MNIKNFAIILMLLVATLFVAAYIPVDEKDSGNPYPPPEATATVRHDPYPPPEATATPKPTKEKDDNDPYPAPTSTQYIPTSAPTETIPEPTEQGSSTCEDIKMSDGGTVTLCPGEKPSCGTCMTVYDKIDDLWGCYCSEE